MITSIQRFNRLMAWRFDCALMDTFIFKPRSLFEGFNGVIKKTYSLAIKTPACIRPCSFAPDAKGDPAWAREFRRFGDRGGVSIASLSRRRLRGPESRFGR
jgi:hypothetical protein